MCQRGIDRIGIAAARRNQADDERIAWRRILQMQRPDFTEPRDETEIGAGDFGVGDPVVRTEQFLEFGAGEIDRVVSLKPGDRAGKAAEIVEAQR